METTIVNKETSLQPNACIKSNIFHDVQKTTYLKTEVELAQNRWSFQGLIETWVSYMQLEIRFPFL